MRIYGAAARPPAHSPASAHVPLLPRPEASGAGIAALAPPPPRPFITGNAPARTLFFPAFPAPQYGVTSACARCSSACRESGSRERAGSVSKAGARPVDDNKLVAQCRGVLSRLSRQPSLSVPLSPDRRSASEAPGLGRPVLLSAQSPPGLVRASRRGPWGCPEGRRRRTDMPRPPRT